MHYILTFRFQLIKFSSHNHIGSGDILLLNQSAWYLHTRLPTLQEPLTWPHQSNHAPPWPRFPSRFLPKHVFAKTPDIGSTNINILSRDIVDGKHVWIDWEQTSVLFAPKYQSRNQLFARPTVAALERKCSELPTRFWSKNGSVCYINSQQKHLIRWNV